ncbi:MAG TPA: DEAD/DEAH box helicase, partial [Planctomycetota bacterium]|nr:DEAD/DEAH box helicase [Planctomycetota bacterium]
MEPPLDLKDVLGEGGVLSRRLPGFRVRPSQQTMAQAISDAISGGHHAVIEAGTGTGKSLAYLVPALLNWVALGKKVVISTHTIALQEQLFTRDLPLLAACLPIEFIAEKTLGRGNYLGLRRMEQALLRANTLLPGDSESEALKAIFRWSAKTPSGVRQDLAATPSAAVWDLVKSETDNCLGKRCPTYEACFFQSARRRWHHADILITNHALYLTDLRLRQMDAGILPDHDLLIIDEAHRFESVASEHFGLEISRRGAQYLLRRIMGTSRFPGILRKGSLTVHDDARRVAQECAAATSLFFDAVDEWLESRDATMVRIREPGIWQDVLSGPFLQLAGLLHSMGEASHDQAEGTELVAFSNRCREIAVSSRRLLAMGELDSVYYAERNELRSETQVVARPLNVAAILRENLFKSMRSVIMTSATLSTDGTSEGLNFFRERMGCEAGESLRLSTPFDLKEQVQVRVASELPEPDHPEFAQRACARALAEILATG